MSARERFEGRVDKHGPIPLELGTPCWDWRGSVDKAGYPKMWLNGNSIAAQRASYLLSGRVLAPEERVVNVCRRRTCVRPEHLVAATLHEANALRSRGRNHLGGGNVHLIRKLIRDEEATAEQLALSFDVRPEFLREIVELG